MKDIWFWWAMFFANLLIPISMVVFGRVMRKHPAKKIGQGWCSYRTAMSQKNQETWNFAQNACGRLWQRGGWILLVVSIIEQLPFRGCDVETVGKAALVLCTLQCVCMVGTVFLVEMALRRNFNADGRRKDRDAAEWHRTEPF